MLHSRDVGKWENRKTAGLGAIVTLDFTVIKVSEYHNNIAG